MFYNRTRRRGHMGSLSPEPLRAGAKLLEARQEHELYMVGQGDK